MKFHLSKKKEKNDFSNLLFLIQIGLYSFRVESTRKREFLRYFEAINNILLRLNKLRFPSWRTIPIQRYSIWVASLQAARLVSEHLLLESNLSSVTSTSIVPGAVTELARFPLIVQNLIKHDKNEFWHAQTAYISPYPGLDDSSVLIKRTMQIRWYSNFRQKPQDHRGDHHRDYCAISLHPPKSVNTLTVRILGSPSIINAAVSLSYGTRLHSDPIC